MPGLTSTVALCPPPALRAAALTAAGQLAWTGWASASAELQPWQYAWALPGGGALLQPPALLQDGSGESSERRPRPSRRSRLLPASSASSSGGSSSQLGVQLNDPLPRQQQPGGGPGGEERDKDFFANVGDAIRTLREDYPLLFAKELNCESAGAAGCHAWPYSLLLDCWLQLLPWPALGCRTKPPAWRLCNMGWCQQLWAVAGCHQ